MNKNFFYLAVLAVVLIVAALLAGCAKRSYKDGVYAAKSGADDSGAWGEVTVTIADGEVADCLFVTRQKDGTIKAEDYGKVNGVISNQDFYNKAQLAVRAMDQYARTFRETGDLAKVDVVTGATIAFNQFNEAVTAALEQAVK
ncbi:MAG: FMN-binding protein [Spirochaetaceae bacterium]|jgi:major membrane immunogen (membrane-anchored lipoprotein)|nr:FMN-binding protein [Spirochaetaceae bacterium]